MCKFLPCHMETAPREAKRISALATHSRKIHTDSTLGNILCAPRPRERQPKTWHSPKGCSMGNVAQQGDSSQLFFKGQLREAGGYTRHTHRSVWPSRARATVPRKELRMMHPSPASHTLRAQEPRTVLLPASSSHLGPATWMLFVQGVTLGVQFPSTTVKILSPAL